jgi:phosphoribosylaminoimidazole carboxylase (NCAIR synthetase)
VLCDNQEALKASMDQFSGERVVIKQRTGGYDGKGVDIVSKAAVLSGDYQTPGPCVVEQFYSNITEYAVIVAADQHGHVLLLPMWSKLRMQSAGIHPREDRDPDFPVVHAS